MHDAADGKVAQSRELRHYPRSSNMNPKPRALAYHVLGTFSLCLILSHVGVGQ